MKATPYRFCVGMLFASLCWADGTETLGPPSIPIADGTGIAVGGVGLVNSQPGTISIDVPGGATIKQVLLYIGGTMDAIPQVTPVMNVQVNGSDVAAQLIGGPTDTTSFITASYRADLTGLGFISAGPNMVEVSGLDYTRDNDGAGILVIFDDSGSEAAIELRDGNDFVYINRAGPLMVSEAQTFLFDSSNKDRVGNVEFFVASVAGGGGSGVSCRPNSFEVTTGGSTAMFSDQLDSLDGPFWDTVSLAVTVPAGETELTLQIFSRDDGFACPGNVPASMSWVAAGLAVQKPARDDCWITTGGFHRAGDPTDGTDFSFGGNVGPPPKGSWQVIDHNTGDNFHAFDVSIVSCEVINLTGPNQPGGKKGFKINKASFEGVGRLNFVHGFPFTGFVHDAGEPGGKKGNDQDFFSITVRDANTNAVVFEASAPLEGGNVQIHPPTGKKK